MSLPERMPCLYNTEQDLHGRLHGTICRYRGDPVYVYIDGTVVYLRHPVTMENITKIKWNDPDFDISSPELGYMNLILAEKSPKNKVLYVERQPVKKYRQGLCSTHLMYSDIKGDSEKIHVPGWPVEHWVSSEGFYSMLKGSYPSLDYAFEILETEEILTVDQLGEKRSVLCKEIAISKDTAIERTKSGVYQVYYKTDNVGWVAPGTRQVNVKSSEVGWIISKFLREFSWKVE